MGALLQKLADTETAEWLRTHMNGKRDGYLSAVTGLLATSQVGLTDVKELSKRELIPPATFYNLFGPTARKSLLSRLDPRIQATQPHRSPHDQVVIEAKVRGHWQYRQGWFAELQALETDDPEFAVRTLIRVLVIWARNNVHTARIHNHTPPVSAVEDLYIICGRKPNLVADIHRLLLRVVQIAARDTEPSPNVVLDVVLDDLKALLSTREPIELAVELADRATKVFADVEYHLPRMPEERRRALRDELAPQLTTLMRIFDDYDE